MPRSGVKYGETVALWFYFNVAPSGGQSQCASGWTRLGSKPDDSESLAPPPVMVPLHFVTWFEGVSTKVDSVTGFDFDPARQPTKKSARRKRV
jgi:hypothetical protein